MKEGMEVLKIGGKILGNDQPKDKNSYRTIIRQGLPYKNRAVDCDIWHWRNSLLKLRCGKLVTKSEVQNYAREAYSKAGILNFKASDGWYRRWLNRRTSNEFITNDKDKTRDLNPVTLNKQESKEPKVTNNNKLKMSKEKTEILTINGVPPKIINISTVNEVNLKLNNTSTCSQESTEIITTDFINKEKERISLESDVKISSLLINIDDYSLSNSNTNMSTFPNVTNIENVYNSNSQKDIFKDTMLCIDNSSMDDFFYTSILDDSDEICYKECDDFIPRNYTCNRNKMSSSNLINSELFFSNNIVNQPEKCTKNKSSTERCEILNIKKGKQIESCFDKDLTLNKVLRKGERYLPHFKTKVITYATTSTIKKAAVKFNVSRGTVSEWLKEKEKNARVQLTSKTLPVTESSEVADLVFIKWLEIHQDKLTRQLIIRKTLELFEEYGEVILQKTCPWFLTYIKRYNEKKFVHKPCNKKYIIYPEKFKLQVVRYAQKFTQLAAARMFVIARKRVFEWLSKVKSTGAINAKCPVNPSAYVTDPAIDNQIWIWYKEQPVTPSSKQVREKGRQLYKKAGYSLSCSHGWYYRWRSRVGLPAASNDVTTHDSFLLEWILTKLDNNQNISHNDILSVASKLKKSSVNSQFKSSLGWALRFCKRYPELLQTIPDITTPLPTTMETKVETFKNNLLSYIKEGNIALENIVTMDEIPLNFLLTGNNKRKLLIRRPGFDNCQGSLVISSSANGILLPLMLILKGSAHSIPEWRGPNSIVVVSEKGYMDADIMLLWLQWVCFMNIIGNGILINDCFEQHTCVQAVEHLALHKIKHFVIPGGCSSKLQPLNLIGQQFKHKVEQYWTESLTAECWADGTSHLKSPSHIQIMDWVQKSYSSIAVVEKENRKKAFQQIFFVTDGSGTVSE